MRSMAELTLIIMAAGLGSRYGGLKQIDPVGPNGEIIMDYSIYDAMKAGFDKIVFVINRKIEQAFKVNIGHRIEKQIETNYVYQDVEDVPEGFIVPPERVKPWGTGHAVLTCKHAVNSPFAVINADDFYGFTSFRKIGEYLGSLKETDGLHQYCMVGFKLENTLTENGHVARGICSVTSDGYLKDIQERTRIQKFGSDINYTEDGEHWNRLPNNSTASMNMWGFTPGFFHELESRFPEFLRKSRENIGKAEFFLPTVVDSLITENKARVKVLTSEDRWYGVTYKQDRPIIQKALQMMHDQGIYPPVLWENKD